MRGALGQIQISDGDPGDCLDVPHGSDCPGLLSQCICVDLRQKATVEELKYLLWRAGNYAGSYSFSWDSSDESNLLSWAMDHGGTRTGLVQRSGTGVLYPTGIGLAELAKSAGCVQKIGDSWVGCAHGTLDALVTRSLNGGGWLRVVSPIYRVVIPGTPTPEPDPTPTPEPVPVPAPPPAPVVTSVGVPLAAVGVIVAGAVLAWRIWRS